MLAARASKGSGPGLAPRQGVEEWKQLVHSALVHLTNRRYTQLMDVGRLDLLVRSGVLSRMFLRLIAPYASELNRVRQEQGLAPLASPLDQFGTVDRLLYQTCEAVDFPATEDYPQAT